MLHIKKQLLCCVLSFLTNISLEMKLENYQQI